jgi:CHAD domain-containing protein
MQEAPVYKFQSSLIRLLKEEKKAEKKMSASAVHGFRRQLRICRESIEGIQSGRVQPLFSKIEEFIEPSYKLGRLRDNHVMIRWVGRLFGRKGASKKILKKLHQKQKRCKKRSSKALKKFDRTEFKKLIRDLSDISDIPISSDDLIRRAHKFLKEVLQWQENAYQRKDAASFHRLRLAIKKFRYFALVFLPKVHSTWDGRLKKAQDLLGDHHDLAGLSQKLKKYEDLISKKEKAPYLEKIRQESSSRLEQYHEFTGIRPCIWNKIKISV